MIASFPAQCSHAPSHDTSAHRPLIARVPPDSYRADIDGLRAIAILAVILYHAYPDKLKGGFTGVDIFFVISGFLISSILFTGLRDGSFRFHRFYANRIRRLFPALILVLLTCLAAGWFLLLPDEYASLGRHVQASAVFVQNFVLQAEIGYFDTAAELKPLLHLWSLAVEEQFYLLYPLILWLLRRTGLGVLPALAVLATVSFASNLYWSGTAPERAFFFPDTRFWELWAGGLLAYVHLHHRERALRALGRVLAPLRRSSARGSDAAPCDALSIAGLLLLAASVLLVRREPAFPGFWAVLPVFGTSLLIFAGPDSRVNRMLLANRRMVAIGLISYPLYLWHWPLMSFVRIFNQDSRATMALCIIASFVLAFLTCRYIENPIRFGRRSRWRIAGLAACIGIAGLLGLALDQSRGVPERRTSTGLTFAQLNGTFAPNHVLREHCVRFTEPYECTTGEPPVAMLWGDSYAMHLAGALIRSATPLPFVQKAMPNCRPIADVTHTRHGADWRAECLRKNRDTLAWLEANPHVRYVILSGTFAELEDGGQAHFSDGHIRRLSAEEWTRQLGETLRRVRAMGRMPVIVAPPPRTGGDLGRCVVARHMLGGHPERCDFPLSAQKAGAVYVALEAVAAEHGVPLIRISDLTCPDGMCRTSLGSAPLYRDRGHLSVPGSMALGETHDFAGRIMHSADHAFRTP